MHDWLDARINSLPLPVRIRLQYFKIFGRLPDLRNPSRFSEKCQVLKLRNPDLTRFTDKLLVKDFVAERIGSEYVIPTLYAGDQLPRHRPWQRPFVVKMSHGSGLNIFVREEPDWEALERQIGDMLKFDYGAASGERFYSRSKPKFLIEPMISGNELPVDYKIFTCRGEPQFIQVDTDRESVHKRAFYDLNWKRLPIRFGFPEDTRPVPRPRLLRTMLNCAKELGRDFGFVRIDFYEVSGRLFFGELTFTPQNGFRRFEPDRVDEELGAKWYPIVPSGSGP